MLYLTLAPAIVTPGLWVAGPQDVKLAELTRVLDAGEGAIGAEAIADAGGWRSLLTGATWVGPGERIPGMDMDLRATINRMIELAVREEGTTGKAAARLGVNPSTVYRWRQSGQRPTRVNKAPCLKVVG